MAPQPSGWSPRQRAQWVQEHLPAHLEKNLEDLLGGPDGLHRLLLAESRPALRVNTLKTTVGDARRRLDALGIKTEKVPWSDTTFFVHDEQDRPLGHLFEHQAGHLFLHDAASTLPVQALDPRPDDRVLDLCAAPGGKSTHILARMNDQGLLVANDPKPQRVNHLVSTLDRMGSLACIVTQRDGRHASWPVLFDRVLVDAPCTNTGGIHHTPGPAFKQHKDTPERHVRLQRRLLMSAAHATRPGGTIVYATCTLDVTENEGNAAWFAGKHGISLEPHGLPLKGAPLPDHAPSEARDVEDLTLRIHPGDHDTNGFFIARFKRTDEPLPARKEREPATHPGPRQGQTPPRPTGREPIDAVIDHNAIDPAPLEDTHAFSTPNRIWATRIDPGSIEPFLELRPTRIGQLLATPDRCGPRLQFDAATRFGHTPKEAIHLETEDAIAWLAGHSVPAPPDTPGDHHRIVLAGDQPIGASRAYGDTLPCFVPKQRRITDDPKLHGWLAEQQVTR